MLFGKCNVVPAAIGIKIKVGTKVSCFALAHAFILEVKRDCLPGQEEIYLFVGWKCKSSMASRR